ncbi:MAG: phage tail tube protein [Sinomicrobium sp.]|nr:phage tail tube protein [Sinomicrobium sp.]
MKLAGTSWIQIDGDKNWTVADDSVTYATGGPKREAILSSSGVAGWSEKPTVPYIEGSFLDIPDRDFEALKGMTSVTVQLDKPNGKSVILSQAWYAGDYEGDTDGKRKFRFEGKKGKEV